MRSSGRPMAKRCTTDLPMRVPLAHTPFEGYDFLDSHGNLSAAASRMVEGRRSVISITQPPWRSAVAYVSFS